MRTETVEVYSDATNAAVMRHPGRRFPGVLIQGDTLSIRCQLAAEACEAARGKLSDDDYQGLIDLRDWLQDLLDHYAAVLTAHGMSLPFPDAATQQKRPEASSAAKSVPSQRVLTDEQAYAAMFSFLKQLPLKSTVGAVLSDLSLLADGGPADRAVVGDWRRAVDYALRGGRADDLKLT